MYYWFMRAPDAQKFVEGTISILKKRREAVGWSQRALAIRAGVDPKTVNLIERGVRSPTLFTLALLASALDISLAEILARAESETRNK